ncbi:MAG: 3-hydroxyacyl-ACP dehydratase FabZ [Candidatus Omnitrophica bacterium]|nr:3-hydroxyacyl-ACP dehydratase FabZ [Candidatus Omnitrophota bacterium]
MNGQTVDIKKIMEYLPHRYPFILVDRVIDFEKDKWIKAIKNVTINEYFFQGHFPGVPIMPGVLIIEALVQAGGLLILLDNENNRNKIAFFMTIDNAKFRRPVTPGDQILLHVQQKKIIRQNIAQVYGEASVDGKCVAEADLMFSVVDRD